jgi:hypothetical protein
MPLLSLGKAAYARGDGPAIPLVNLLFEQDPRNLEDQTSLIQRPGQSEFADLGDGPRRGVFRQEGVIGGHYYVVSGENLFRVTISGTVTQIGADGAVPGTDLVSMAGNATAIYIANGTGLYKTDGSSVAAFTFPDSAGVVSVGYINGYFAFIRADSQKLYWLAPGSSVIDGLDFLSAELSPDDVAALVISGDELLLFGLNTTEIWDPTTNPDAPFQRVAGRLFPIGCSNRDSVAQAGATTFFVGEDRNAGGRMVYRLDTTPVRISNNDVEEKIRDVDAVDLVGWSFGVDGHLLYCLNTGAETLVYDLSTNIWTTFASYGLPQWRASLGAPRGDGLVVAGDTENGKLWLLDPSLNQDDGDPMERTWPARIQLKGPIRNYNVILEATVGFATIENPDDDPMVEMRFSDDLAQTWSDWEAESLGRQGEFNQIVAWTGLGLMSRPGRDFQFRVTDNVRVTVRQAEYNGSLR